MINKTKLLFYHWTILNNPSSADLLFVFAFISFGETIQCIELPNVTANFSRNNKMPHIVD